MCTLPNVKKHEKTFALNIDIFNLQVLAYMFRFDAKKGFYFYPEMGEEEDAVMWLNRGSTYEKNVEAREDICLIKHGFQIPTGIDVYSAFTEQMRCNEIKFLEGILTFVK